MLCPMIEQVASIQKNTHTKLSGSLIQTLGHVIPPGQSHSDLFSLIPVYCQNNYST